MIIHPGGGGPGIAQIDTQVSIGGAAAADDEARISTVGVWRTEFGRLRVVQRRGLEADDREHWRINYDIHWRRRDRLAEGKPGAGGEDVLTHRRVGPIGG